jgi:hypothetical protein
MIGLMVRATGVLEVDMLRSARCSENSQMRITSVTTPSAYMIGQAQPPMRYCKLARHARHAQNSEREDLQWSMKLILATREENRNEYLKDGLVIYI